MNYGVPCTFKLLAVMEGLRLSTYSTNSMQIRMDGTLAINIHLGYAHGWRHASEKPAHKRRAIDSTRLLGRGFAIPVTA
jgi:ribonuclease HI